MSSELLSRRIRMAVLSFAALNLAACASFQPDGADKPPTLAEKVAERVASADKAHAQGKTDQAFDELEDAIKLDPASKLPWLKKAQIHFDARLYGQAITEAQEALQRDATDLTAKSILAVSGLRVSADALDQLRKVDEVKGSTRSEAESVAKIIREALGEPILLPATAAGATANDKAEGKSKSARKAARASASPASTSATAASASPTASKPAAAPAATSSVAAPATKSTSQPAAAGRSNPFGALQ